MIGKMVMAKSGAWVRGFQRGAFYTYLYVFIAAVSIAAGWGLANCAIGWRCGEMIDATSAATGAVLRADTV